MIPFETHIRNSVKKIDKEYLNGIKNFVSNRKYVLFPCIIDGVDNLIIKHNGKYTIKYKYLDENDVFVEYRKMDITEIFNQL